MGFFDILGIFGMFRDFLGFLGILGIFRDFLGFLGIFGIFRDFRDILGFFFFLTEMFESDFFGVIMDVSTKIWICQPKEILSANEAGMCGF